MIPAADSMSARSPEFMFLNPSPSAMVPGDEALKRWVGQKGQVL